MKIAHIMPNFRAVGGLQVCVHNISERHARMGHQVDVFCWSQMENTHRFSYNKRSFIHFRFTPLTLQIGRLWAAVYLSRIQKAHRFDLWQINGGYPYGLVLADFFQKAKIPCVLRCSGEDIQRNPELGYGIRLRPKIDELVKKNYKKFSALVATSETVRSEYEKIGISPEQIKIIPNGVDIQRISDLQESNHIRKKHRIPKQAKVILTVGRNHPKKGYRLIPEILNKILNSGMDAYWIVIGKGSSQIEGITYLGESVYRLIFIDGISFENGKYDIPSDELIRYYKGADVFAMTSFVETFGIVLIEAMAAGLPIVCFDVPGVRDVAVPECGSMCKIADVDAFAKAIMDIAAAEKPADISERCRNHSMKYSWDMVAKQYLTLYKSLI